MSLILAPAGALSAAPLIEEVIVVAQRVEQNARRVPIAMNAFTYDMLAQRRIIALSDLQTFVPSLQYTTNEFSDMNLSIRGIGSRVAGDDAHSGVSMHVNDFPYPNGQPPIELFDVTRVEVLRGPQGTLYGRNATGGVINVITAQPDFDGLGGYLESELGNYDLLRLRAALNARLNDELAVRLAGLSLDRDGYTRNLAGRELPGIDDDADGRDLQAWRASLLWEAGDATSLRVSYEAFDEHDDRMFAQQLACTTPSVPPYVCAPGRWGLEPRGLGGLFGLTLGLLDVTPLGAYDTATGLRYEYARPWVGDLRKLHVDYEPVYELNQRLWQLGVEHSVDRMDFHLTAGLLDWDWHGAYDSDWQVGPTLAAIAPRPDGIWPMSVLPGGVNGLRKPPCDAYAGLAGLWGGCTSRTATGRLFQVWDRDERMRHWSAEGRVRMQLSDRVAALLGAIGIDSRIDALTTITGNIGDALSVPGLPLYGTDLRLPLYPGFVASPSEYEFESRSVFGEAYLDLRPDLTLTAGVRYNSDSQHIADAQIGLDSTDANGLRLLGPEPMWVRLDLASAYLFGIPTPRAAALLDYYDAGDAVTAAETPAELIKALQRVPPVPKLKEQRRIAGSPTDRSWNAWTGRLGLTWTMTEESMLYGFYSRGYKPGGFNFNASSDYFTYDREDIDGLEAGFKALLGQQTLELNGALFIYRYDGLQLPNEELDNLIPGQVNTNADAEVAGLELEAWWSPARMPQVELEAAYAWLHTELTDADRQYDPNDILGSHEELILLSDLTGSGAQYIAAVADVLPLVDEAVAAGFALGPDVAPAAQNANGIPAWFSRGFLEASGIAVNTPQMLDSIRVDLEGNRLSEAPEHSVRLSASYSWLPALGYLTARWDYYWQDDMYLTAFNRNYRRVDDWDQHNLSLTFETLDGSWTVRGWVQNLENDLHATGGRRTEDTQLAVSEPRTYGLTIHYKLRAGRL